VLQNVDVKEPVLCRITFLLYLRLSWALLRHYVIISIFRMINLVSTKCMAANSRDLYFTVVCTACTKHIFNASSDTLFSKR